MKKSLIFAMAMALGVTASAYAANPFSDVPAGHWAYDSIEKLAAAGVIDGYGDGTFGGDKLMTRYEMAQIVARAMANGADVDKLAAEFADELDALGVRVANLEKKADAVKITGNIRIHYSHRHNKTFTSTGKEDESKMRSRLWFKGQVNDDWSYTGMIQNEQDFINDTGDEDVDFQRAFVNGKLGGLAVQAGRDNLGLVAGGEVYSNRADFVKVSYGKEIKLDVLGGKLSSGARTNKPIKGEEFWAGILSAKLGVVDAAVTYVDIKKQATFTPAAAADNHILAIEAGVPIVKDLKLTGVYLKGDVDIAGEDDGYIVKLNYKGAKANKPGSWGVWAQYGDVAGSAFIFRGYESGLYDEYDGEGYKGYQVGANYAFAKNMVGQIEYTDLESKANGEDANELWTELVITF